MKARTRARALALKALYEIDLAGHPPATVLRERIQEEGLEPELAAFARQIVEGVVPLRPWLDQHIARHAPAWPVEHLPAIERNLLRMALWEMALSPERTPPRVVVNEAVELAKMFGSESTPRFVNGVLGSLVRELEAIRRDLRRAMGDGDRDSLGSPSTGEA
ncbi:MAG: transcription antitermination factor NusB [Chloroflexi bacterium]|nr:transcription antitermination factor NusB [Chloroflexota bacterium]